MTAPPTSRPTSHEEAAFGIVDWTLFLVVSFIWGSSFLLIAIGLEALTTGAVTFLRVGFGALALWAVRVFRVASGRRPESAVSFGGDRIHRDDWRPIVLLSFLWVAIPFTLFPLAQQHINSALAGLLNGATPVFVAVVSIFLTKVVPTSRQMVGIGIGLIGLVLLSWPSLNAGDSQAGGVAMVVLATVCYGFSINIAGPLQRRYGAVTLMSWVLAFATLWVVPIGLRDIGGNRWDFGVFAAVVVLGVVNTGLAYWAMASLVGRVGSIRASLITYLIPVVSLVLGVLIRSDKVAPLALVGAAVITAGALLASRRSQPATATTASEPVSTNR